MKAYLILVKPIRCGELESIKDINTFEDEVNKAIAVGYKPQGGVSTMMNREGIIMFQAIYIKLGSSCTIINKML